MCRRSPCSGTMNTPRGSMLSGLFRASRHRRSHALLAALWLAFGAAAAQDIPLHERFAEIQETARVFPQRGLPMMAAIEGQARRGTPLEQAEFLVLSADVRHCLGKH